MGQEATVPRAPRMGKGRHKTNKIREEARQPESHIPGNEAEMKKEAQLGETSCENRPTIVLGTAGQDPPGAGTATLCLNVIKDPVGADVWNSFTLAHLAAERVQGWEKGDNRFPQLSYKRQRGLGSKGSSP